MVGQLIVNVIEGEKRKQGRNRQKKLILDSLVETSGGRDVVRGGAIW